MNREVIERVGSGVGVLVALGVGMLLGGRFCAPEPPEPPAIELVECPPTVVCPAELASPQAEEPRPKPVLIEEPQEALIRGTRRLPPSPEIHDPAARRQLLAFVRDNSDDLRECRARFGDAIRTNVVLGVSQDGTIRRVDLQAGPNELPGPVSSCLRDQMLQWQLPADLVQGRERLMFLLTI